MKTSTNTLNHQESPQDWVLSTKTNVERRRRRKRQHKAGKSKSTQTSILGHHEEEIHGSRWTNMKTKTETTQQRPDGGRKYKGNKKKRKQSPKSSKYRNIKKHEAKKV